MRLQLARHAPARRPTRTRPRTAVCATLTVALLWACGADPVAADTDTGGDDVHHLDGPGCEGAIRYRGPRATGVGAPERARLGLLGVPVADAFAASLCSDFCHAAERCGDDLGGRAACLGHCASLLEEGRVNGVACYASDCRQKARCLDEGPVQGVSGCEALCADIARCPALAILGLTPEETACRAQCAGRAAARPTFADAVPCLANAARSCDLDDALGCLPNGGLFCPSVCLEVDACPAGSPLRAVWETSEACFTECDARDPVMAFKAATCFETLGCGATRACIDVVSPVCEAYFTEAARSCDAASSWPASFALLSATCDVTRFAAVDDPGEVAACLAERGSCDALDDRLCPSVALAGRLARCEPLCSATCDCGLLTPDDCLRLCTAAPEDDAELDALEACAAQDDCAALTACADELVGQSTVGRVGEGDDPCDRYCRARVDCLGASAHPGCRDACATRLDAGDAGPLAAVGCYEAGGCAAFASCDATAPGSAACEAACDAATVACGRVLAGFDAGRAACTAYCAGLVTTWGADDGATAGCVVDAADARCVIASDAGCRP